MLQSFQKRREKDKIKRQGDKLQNNPTPNGPPCFRGAFPQPSRAHARRNQPTPPPQLLLLPPCASPPSWNPSTLLGFLPLPSSRLPRCRRPPAAACTVLPVSAAPFVFRAPAASAPAVSRCSLSWRKQCRKILNWICARLLSWISWSF